MTALVIAFLVLPWSTSSLSTTISQTITKQILVTGGNKGIGRAICQKLLQDYSDVNVILGARDKGRGEEAIEFLKGEIGEELCANRLSLLEIDTSSDESVLNAASTLSSFENNSLHAIINNAGIGFGYPTHENVNVNYFGPRRVNECFIKYLNYPAGRIVNIASASGPNFISSCTDPELRSKLTEPWTIAGGITELDDIARSVDTDNGYGVSKALLNAYTWIHARSEPELIINSVTPGWILTDMTRGMGASNAPLKGAVPPVWLAMSSDLNDRPTGRYYGSDCVRSPLHFYRGPGDAPYEGPDGPTVLNEKDNAISQ